MHMWTVARPSMLPRQAYSKWLRFVSAKAAGACIDHHKLDHAYTDFHEGELPDFADLPHPALNLLDRIDKVIRHYFH